MMQNNQHSIEIEKGDRFQFGKNWLKFLKLISDERIKEAEISLQQNLELETVV